MINVEDVTKIYPDGNGINKVELFVAEGEVISVIGPNGAGKSTLLNIISGKNVADNGLIKLNGNVLNRIERKQIFGYMPDNYEVADHLKAWELVNLISDYKFNGKYKHEMKEDFMKLGLEKYARKRVSELSMGNRKKIAMIIAFMGNPKGIILDEPTNGIDTAGIIFLKEKIEHMKKENCSIVISSHILDFVNAVCDRHYFLKNGEVEKMVGNNADLELIYKELFL